MYGITPVYVRFYGISKLRSVSSSTGDLLNDTGLACGSPKCVLGIGYLYDFFHQSKCKIPLAYTLG